MTLRFLIDNCLSPLVCGYLRDAKLDALHVRDIGCGESPDETIMQIAVRQERIVVTADYDFSTLLALSGHVRPSVMILRGHQGRSAKTVGDRILAHLGILRQPLEDGSLIVMEDSRIRIRPLPIGGRF